MSYLATTRQWSASRAVRGRHLEALGQGGYLRVFGPGKPSRHVARVPVAPEPISDESRALLAFLSDVRTVEEWAGVDLDLPPEVPADEVHQVVSLAALIRKEGRSVTWHNARLTLPEESAGQLSENGAMRIEEEAHAVVLGREIKLGFLRRDLPEFEVVSVAPDCDQPGYVHVEIKPPHAGAASIVERLSGLVPGPVVARRRLRGRRRTSVVGLGSPRDGGRALVVTSES
jgi:hypothetical protein